MQKGSWTIIISFMLLSLPMVLFAQPTHEGDTVNLLDDQGRRHGKWIKNYKGSTILRYKGQFDHGTPVGTFKYYYYKDGKVKAITEYSPEGRVARTKMYHRDGSLMAEGKYVNQKKDSVWVFYDPKGNLSARESYSKGKKDGASIVYFLDGDTAEIKHFRNGTPHGKWEQYYRNDEPNIKARYVDGNLDGKATYFYKNGQVKLQGKYEATVRHGKWVSYNKDGTFDKMIIYDYGEIDRIVNKEGKVIHKGDPPEDTTSVIQLPEGAPKEKDETPERRP